MSPLPLINTMDPRRLYYGRTRAIKMEKLKMDAFSSRRILKSSYHVYNKLPCLYNIIPMCKCISVISVL